MKEVNYYEESNESSGSNNISDIKLNKPMFWTLIAYIVFVVVLAFQMAVHFAIRKWRQNRKNKKKASIPSSNQNEKKEEIKDQAEEQSFAF